MPSLTDGPEEPGSFEAEQALLWGELQEPFYRRNNLAVARTVYTQLGMWAVVAGTRVGATTDWNVHIINSITPQGLRLTVNWESDRIVQSESFVNGQLIEPEDKMSDQQRYEYLSQLRYLIGKVTFTAEKSEAVAKRLFLKNSKPGKLFTLDSIYTNHPGLIKWRDFYLFTWGTGEHAEEQDD